MYTYKISVYVQIFVYVYNFVYRYIILSRCRDGRPNVPAAAQPGIPARARGHCLHHPRVAVLRRVLPPRDWYFIAEQPAPALHLAHPEGCAALRIVLVTVPRVIRSCEHLHCRSRERELPPSSSSRPSTPGTPLTLLRLLVVYGKLTLDELGGASQRSCLLWETLRMGR